MSIHCQYQGPEGERPGPRIPHYIIDKQNLRSDLDCTADRSIGPSGSYCCPNKHHDLFVNFKWKTQTLNLQSTSSYKAAKYLQESI